MTVDEVRTKGIAFFSMAIEKWHRLINLYNGIRRYSQTEGGVPIELISEANSILSWFQENYSEHAEYSKFNIVTMINGRETKHDPVFDLIFRGAKIQYIERNQRSFLDDLNQGEAVLRGHLASIKNLKSLEKDGDGEEVPLRRIRKVLSKVDLVIEQMNRRRKNKISYVFQDEYDLQDLIHALLTIDFDDIRKEEWTPSYAGGASRIDLVLKKEKILIEVKKTSERIQGKELGDQLIEDIARYKEYPDARTLFCFICDSEHHIENPAGLISDLEKQSTNDLVVEVIISSR